MSLSLDDLRSLAGRHGFPDVDIAAAVAMAESGGNPNALGDTTIDPRGSVGLWQIFRKAHPEYEGVDLTDPDTNADAAYAISSGGTNWHPWSTFTSGAYLRYMPATPTPPPSADSGGGAGFGTTLAVLVLAAAGGWAFVHYHLGDQVAHAAAPMLARLSHALQGKGARAA